MSVPFFYHESISTDTEIILDEETSRHIVQVLRMQQGEKLRLTDGRGTGADAEITHSHKKRCSVQILSSSFAPRGTPALTVAISLVKNTGRFEWFLEKATELGTAQIIPLICDRTEKQSARTDRLASICKSAMLQSLQVWMPAVSPPAPFAEVVRNAPQEQKLFGHITEGSVKNLSAAINSSAGSHIILIGPEGDLSSEEIEMAKASGFEGVSLGKTVLRVETAGIYAAVVHAAWT